MAIYTFRTIVGNFVVGEAITEINLFQAELKKPPAAKTGGFTK